MDAGAIERELLSISHQLADISRLLVERNANDRPLAEACGNLARACGILAVQVMAMTV